MSKQNKFFAAATTAALVASAIVPVASAAEFKDANQIAPWAKEAVETLAAKDIIGGNPDGSFNPKGNVTRAEAAKMFKVALDLPVQGTESFTDVKDGQWFQDVIIAVSNAGIVDGMGNGLFVPNGKLTRAEAAKMIVKAYGFEGEADLSKFADADKVAGKWFEAPLSTAVAAGIIAGKGNLLAANDSITRQEFAVMLTRAIDTAQEANTEELLAAVEKATTALDTAVKALNTEVKAEEIAAAKAEVVAAKDAITALEKAVADAKDVITTEASAKATTAIEAAKKAIAATEAVIAKAEEDAKVLAVESITAINATTIAVNFSKAVTEADVVTAGKAHATNIAFTTLDNKAVNLADAASTAVLSEDGKKLTITVKPTEIFEGRYKVVIKDVKEKGSLTAKIKTFDDIVSIAKDTTAPTVVGFEQVDADDVKINFSEPIAAGATFEFKKADGTVIATGTSAGQIPAVSYSVGAKSVTVDLSKITAGEKITATIKNAKDLAGNLITPQPATIVIERKELAAFAPKISSITQTGAKTFNVKFSEDLDGTLATDTAGYATNIVLDPANVVTKIDKVSDSEYKVTTTNNLNGLATVKILNTKIVNKFGQAAGTGITTLDKLVTFTADTEAPKATAKLATDKNNKQVIELTFDKDVKLGTGAVTVTGDYVNNFVTTTLVSAPDATAVYADGKGDNKKVVHIPLAANADATKNLAVEGAVYNLKLASAQIVSDADVKMTDVTTSFTRGKDGTATSNTEKATAAVTLNASNDKVTVTFTVTSGYELDGASATNIANYKIDGAVIESATLAPVSSTTQVVTLNLKKGSSTFTGDRNVTVENVKVKNSTVVMDKHTEVLASLVENVRPTVEKAEITGASEITVTFSEAVKAVDLKEAFLVKAGSTTLNTTTTAATASGKTVKLTVENPGLTAAVLAETITIEPAKANGQVNTAKFIVEDLAGNKLEAFSPITVVKP